MATFHTWLEEQRDRSDTVGEVAQWWAGDAADRPRVSSPSGIQKYLDLELREGKLKDRSTDEKGKLREAFALSVREYHDRDKPPDQSRALSDFMAEQREAMRMLRHGQNRIMAALGLDTPLDGPFTVSPDQVRVVIGAGGSGHLHDGELNPGHVEALRVRARLGDLGARQMLAEHGFGVGAIEQAAAALEAAGATSVAYAEPGADGPERDADGLADLGAGAGTPGAGESLSAAPPMPVSEVFRHAIEHGDWAALHVLADHAAAAALEGMPDDYAA